MKKSSSNVYKIKGEEDFVRPLELSSLKKIRNKIDHGVMLLQMEREAYQKGFEAGEKAGFEFGSQKIEVVLKRLSSVLSELSTLKADLYNKMEAEIARLALAIAKKIVHCEISLNNDAVIHIAKAAIKAGQASGSITIKVNPDDFEYMVKAKSELLSHVDGIKNINIEEADGISKGGCVLETAYDEVDARIEQGFKEIEKAVNDMLKKEK